MKRRIVFTRPDGGTEIVAPVINTDEDITEEMAEQRAWDALPAGAISPRWIAKEEVPTDRTFRSAWKADWTIDMTKAVEIAKAVVSKAGGDPATVVAKTPEELKAIVMRAKE